MKNILLVTDLSDTALAGALETAKLASSQQARLILVYSFVPTPETEAATEDANETPRPVPEHEIQRRLDALAQRLHLTHGTSVTRLVRPGLQPDELSRLARQINAGQVLQFTAANQAEMPVSPPENQNLA